jgi:hypothetical protein
LSKHIRSMASSKVDIVGIPEKVFPKIIRSSDVFLPSQEIREPVDTRYL